MILDSGLRAALTTAKKSAFKQHRLGAVIVKGGNILSTGYNQLRYTKELKNPTLHAEEAAILKMLKEKRLHDLAGSVLYVSRYTRGGKIGLAAPCPRCMALIQSVGINEVIYTTNNKTTETLKIC